MNNTNETGALSLPLIPLRGVTVFPNTVTTIDLGREISIAALHVAMDHDQKVFLVSQTDAEVENPTEEDLYKIGTVATIRQAMPSPDGVLRVLVSGEYRAAIVAVTNQIDYMLAAVSGIHEFEAKDSNETIALMRAICTQAHKLARARGLNMNEMLQTLDAETDAGKLCDAVGSAFIKRGDTRQQLLECDDITARLKLTIDAITAELQITVLEENIRERAHESIEKGNREYFLHEEIRAIQDELGQDEDEDIVELRKKLAQSQMTDEAREKVEKELKRLARTSAQAPESTVSLNYIEYMLELPWGKYDGKKIDIAKARKVLEADHFGMRDIKDRLLEYLAVRSVTDEVRSPIICLVGPPGVGKTSIARSVARALGRKFTQMSLGGVQDESEIRGHRKTYVGAMPGRIISSINQCKSMNPVFLLDEIDKLTNTAHGNPAAALLETLDPEQNSAFRDHYLEAPFDLSEVLFITTANTTEPIDKALLDRMEVIEVPSYTQEEKVQIAKKHLIPKQMKYHNLKKGDLKISDKTAEAIIDGYTRESGVRTLERMIGKICRKVTLKRVEDPETAAIAVKPVDLKDYLGAQLYLRQKPENGAAVGMVNGLAWTSVGGEVMPIEVAVYEGKGKMELTGSLGDVMKESASLARSNVRGMLCQYGIAADYFDTHDIHIHVPEGATPKDGPSAGVALTCAVLSAVTGFPANNACAMTGEITLRGKVLPVGGVREKLLAAYRMGITELMLPKENMADLEKIDESIRNELHVTPLETIDDAIRLVLVKGEEKC